MPQLAQIPDDVIRKLLASVSATRSAQVTALLDELNPDWFLDRESDSILFEASPGLPNHVYVGLKCTQRLQIHAYAAAAILSSIDKPQHERAASLAPVDKMLNWAVGVDLTPMLEHHGFSLPVDHVLRPTEPEPPHVALQALSARNKTLGMGLFTFATGWILLHELAHLKLGHTVKEGFPSLVQENEADRFAAELMVDNSGSSIDGQKTIDRLCAVFGIAVALVWITVFNVYFGQLQTRSHPEGYNRLFQVLDQIIDRNDELEYWGVWQSVSQLLFVHMRSAGYEFNGDDARMQGDPRDVSSYLIDRISRFDRKV